MPRLFQVDAFTDRPFHGNPAAVCLLEQGADESWMQQVAFEMNLAETAFVYRDGSEFQLRWFTPLVEVNLCGHATLATAHVLWETGMVPGDTPCIFQSRSGRLQANKSDSDNMIRLDFPAGKADPVDPPAGLIDALAVSPEFVGLSSDDFVVKVGSADAVRNLSPDMTKLVRLDSRGVIVTAKDESGRFDFISRFFGPAVGIDEDPVTGSAHCVLGPFWMEELGKTNFNAWQASKRGGQVRLEVHGDRVHLFGNAVTVLRGELTC